MASKYDRLLKKAVVIGGIITVSGGLFFQSRLQRKIGYQFYVREPMKLLRGYPYAEQLLGKPIQMGHMRFNVDHVNITPLATYIKIPVKGPKASALLYSECSKETPESEWEVTRLDLQMDPDTPRWTFYKRVTSDDELTNAPTKPIPVDSSNKVASDSTKNIEPDISDLDSLKEKEQKKELKWL